MLQIIDYAISRSINTPVLGEQVAALIKEGWQPFGSLTSSPCEINALGEHPTSPGEPGIIARVMYAQALVKYVKV